ncbi:MAG: penicillin-binding protein [Comamonadaceae bacterium]|nr:MAG: penicillin-binding protein [Comamonadaceae bacterium]
MDRFKQLLATAAHHVRHPTRRGVLIALACLPALVLLYVLILIPFTPSISDLQKVKTARPSVVMSADGQVLATFQRANREWVKLDQISPYVIEALIATEDRRFHEHHGIDVRRTAGAVVKTFTGNLQGGSTITQQLARNLYPEEIGRAASLTRKVKEAITALKIEAVYSKQEILETYLNTVPFLYNAWGIEMAARTYFDKSAGTLDPLEAATLVGMLKGTAYYNPVLNPERAEQRRNLVLAQLARSGKLDQPTLKALQAQPLKIDFERQTDQLGHAPHLSQQLRKWLIEWADRSNYNIFADGLVVRTTIDSRLQDMAVKSLQQHADRLQKLANADWGSANVWKAKAGSRKDAVLAFIRETQGYKDARAAGKSEADAVKDLLATSNFIDALREDKTRLQAGFFAVDPANGEVRAWVGSRDFATDQFDHVQQARRQPGSTFKPFVYGAAFDQGSTPNDTFNDGDIDIPLGNGEFWRPTDAGGPSYQAMTLRQGLMYSKNTITAQAMQIVGPARVAAFARAAGVRQSKLEEVPSLALGTSPVTLKEMVAAYATIVNDGRYIEPIIVTGIEDREGRVLERFVAKAPETAMPATVAQTLVDVMRGVIDQGTGSRIRGSYGIKADVAGKTGTTQNNTDAWFILMQPQLVAGAWVGFNDNRVTMGSGWGQGSQGALPIVGEVFRLAIKAKVIDGERQFAAPRLAVVEPAPQVPDPSQDPNATQPGAERIYNLPGSNGELGPTGALPPDAGQAPEGSWRPAPIIRYVNVPQPVQSAEVAPVNAANGAANPVPETFTSRVLAPPDRGPAPVTIRRVP